MGRAQRFSVALAARPGLVSDDGKSRALAMAAMF